MKKYERRPVFLEPHVFVRSVFNNRIFAVPKLSCVVNIPPYLLSYTTCVDLHNTIKINPAHFFMTVQYKTHRAYTVVVCAALCLSSAYESGGAKTEGLAELSRARHRRPQSMYSETAMIKRYMCDKTVYKSSPKKCRTI